MANLTLLLPDLDCGGAQRVMLTLAGQFAELGHDVELIALRAGGVLAAEIPAGIRLVELMPEHLAGWRLAARALLALRRHLAAKRQTTAILASVTGANIVALLAAAGLPAGVRPRVVIRHENTGANLKRGLRDRVASHLYARADEIVTISEPAAEDLHGWLRVDSGRVHVIANPVDGDSLAEAARLPLDGPIAGDAPMVLSIGRLTAQKDYPTLLRAFERLVQDRPARLVVLGEGEDRAALLALADALGIRDRVTLPGVVGNPYPWIAASDLFVLSSRWEGMPVALLEAIALGANIVSTDCRSGPGVLLAAGRFGRLVPVGDVAALAAAMAAALDSPPAPALVREGALPYRPRPIAEAHLALLLGSDAS